MGNQAIAVLDWYLAMGVDEVVEETPQNHLAPKATSAPPTTPTITQQPATILPSSAPSTYTPPSEALEKARILAAGATTLAELRQAVLNFREIAICKSATQAVFAEGIENAPLMVIGEAPGADEDRNGVPFCGESGQLLNKMLAAINHSRQENAYITNAVFWRPPGNRTPTAEEIAICQPFVHRHIALFKPKIILLLGAVAAQSVLNHQGTLAKLRGTSQQFETNPVIVSYHPSYLLRQPSQKRLAWSDLLRVKALLESNEFKINS